MRGLDSQFHGPAMAEAGAAAASRTCTAKAPGAELAFSRRKDFVHASMGPPPPPCCPLHR